MKQAFFAIIAVLLMTLPAFAMTDEEKESRYQDCSKIRNDKDRDACMKSFLEDAQEKKAESTEKEQSKKAASKWHISRDKSKFNDSKTYFAILFADGDEDKNPGLLLRCEENKTEAAIFWEGTLPYGDDTPLIEYRIDKKMSVISATEVSSNRRATFFKKPIQIIKELSHAKKMVARTQILGAGMKSISFDLTGIEEVAKELSATCNWKLE